MKSASPVVISRNAIEIARGVISIWCVAEQDADIAYRKKLNNRTVPKII